MISGYCWYICTVFSKSATPLREEPNTRSPFSKIMRVLMGTGYSLTPKMERVASGLISPMICSMAMGEPLPPTHSKAWSMVKPSGTSVVLYAPSAKVKSASLSSFRPNTYTLLSGKVFFKNRETIYAKLPSPQTPMASRRAWAILSNREIACTATDTISVNAATFILMSRGSFTSRRGEISTYSCKKPSIDEPQNLEERK